MHKKLLVSFVYISIFIIVFAQASYACGEVSSPQKTQYEYKNSGFQMYTGKFGSNNSAPTDAFKLIRSDFPIVDYDISSESNSSPNDDVKIIYSPDLPTPLNGSSIKEEDANIYLALEMELVKKVNEARVAAGQDELIYCEELSYFARNHSKEMSEKHFFSHNSPYSGSYVTRLYASGINYISSGENIARFSDIESAHEALLKSFGHKKNMLSPKYTHVGIGITWDEKLEVYCITQWFAKFYED